MKVEFNHEHKCQFGNFYVKTDFETSEIFLNEILFDMSVPIFNKYFYSLTSFSCHLYNLKFEGTCVSTCL